MSARTCSWLDSGSPDRQACVGRKRMGNCIRFLTYNTQLRSWGMEVLAQQNLFPVTSAEERAATIAERILSSREDYDVICLNEVFDEDARAVLGSKLIDKYP